MTHVDKAALAQFPQGGGKRQGINIAAVGEGALTQRLQILRQIHLSDITVREGVVAGESSACRDRDGVEGAVFKAAGAVLGACAGEGACAGAVKCMSAHESHSTRQGHILQLGAVAEGVGVDLHQCIGEGDALQIGAALKGVGLNDGYALGNDHRGDCGVSRKDTEPDGLGIELADPGGDLQRRVRAGITGNLATVGSESVLAGGARLVVAVGVNDQRIHHIGKLFVVQKRLVVLRLEAAQVGKHAQRPLAAVGAVEAHGVGGRALLVIAFVLHNDTVEVEAAIRLGDLLALPVRNQLCGIAAANGAEVHAAGHLLTVEEGDKAVLAYLNLPAGREGGCDAVGTIGHAVRGGDALRQHQLEVFLLKDLLCQRQCSGVGGDGAGRVKLIGGRRLLYIGLLLLNSKRIVSIRCRLAAGRKAQQHQKSKQKG